MANKGVDDFNRADNASSWTNASDGQTWSRVVGGGTPAILSNGGKITTNSFDDTVMRIGSDTTADTNFLMKVKVANGNAGPVWRYQDASNYYRCVQEDGGTLYLQKRVSGSNTTITTINPSGFSTSSFFWIRIIASGTSIKVTWWLDGNSEPGSPNIDTTDSAITSAGGYGIASVSYSGGTANFFDDLTITDNSAGNPPLDLVDTATSTTALTLATTIADSNTTTTTESATLAPSYAANETVLSVSSPTVLSPVSSSSSSVVTETWSILAALGLIDASQVVEIATLAPVIVIVDASSATDSISFAIATIVTVYAIGYGRDGYQVGEGA